MRFRPAATRMKLSPALVVDEGSREGSSCGAKKLGRAQRQPGTREQP